MCLQPSYPKGNVKPSVQGEREAKDEADKATTTTTMTLICTRGEAVFRISRDDNDDRDDSGDELRLGGECSIFGGIFFCFEWLLLSSRQCA